MNKQIVINILTKKQINVTEVTEFVIEYTKEKLNKEITSEQVSQIVILIQRGIFDLNFAAREAARLLNLYVMDAIDKQGRIISTFVYE